ncbi:MAG: hypothetical protein FWF41_04910 [Betaproteobacteria bacterium]|nr:hypothetical protein [Betaproteobacteria bacterium]
MSIFNNRIQALGLLNAIADRGCGYDPDYVDKLLAYQWLHSYAKDKSRRNRPLNGEESAFANELFKDVVHALEILGLKPEEVYLRLKEGGLREDVCRIQAIRLLNDVANQARNYGSDETKGQRGLFWRHAQDGQINAPTTDIGELFEDVIQALAFMEITPQDVADRLNKHGSRMCQRDLPGRKPHE